MAMSVSLEPLAVSKAETGYRFTPMYSYKAVIDPLFSHSSHV